MDRSRDGGDRGPGTEDGAGKGGAAAGSDPKADAESVGGQRASGAPGHPVLLFDGDCGLCARSVQFVARRDPGGVFRFAPLGSPLGADLVERAGIGAAGDTLVLLVDGRVLIRSDAVRAILLRLPGWRWAGLLLGLVPRPVRDLGYRLVARVRRRLFPPPPACPLPDPRIRARVLEP